MNDNPNAVMRPDTTDRENLHKMLSDMLITITDQYFENRDIFIDGYRFINCVFQNCRLNILRGTFELHHCSLNSSQRIWGEDAIKCIQFFTHDTALPVDTVFRSKLNPDGTFSVGKGATLS